MSFEIHGKHRRSMDSGRWERRRPAGSGAHRAILVALTSALALAGAASADVVTLRLKTAADAPELSSIVAVGLEPRLLDTLRSQPPARADWKSVFPVYTGGVPKEGGGKPPVAGSWTVETEALRFTPRYPLVPGLEYAARLDLAGLRALAGDAGVDEAPIEAVFSLPRQHVEPSTVVSEVYPTASELPENLLKLYLHFSAPMSRGEAYQHIRLVDAGGRDARHVFLEVGEELWDAEQRRLTLFFDPGRIKRGLRPHMEAGPPLTAGAAYRLVIDAAWRDADGLPLARGFEKAFTVTAADRRSPDPGAWRIEPPAAGTREPLRMKLDESLDHGLLKRVVRVLDAGGQSLAGKIEIAGEERVFRFIPEQPWRAGSYAVAAESILEDLAGNNLRKVFDLDVRAPVPSGPPVEDVVTLAFTVAATP